MNKFDNWLRNLPDSKIGEQTALKVIAREQLVAGQQLTDAQKRLIQRRRLNLIGDSLTQDLLPPHPTELTAKTLATAVLVVTRAEFKLATRVGAGLGTYLGIKMRNLDVIEKEDGWLVQKKKINT